MRFSLEQCDDIYRSLGSQVFNKAGGGGQADDDAGWQQSLYRMYKSGEDLNQCQLGFVQASVIVLSCFKFQRSWRRLLYSWNCQKSGKTTPHVGALHAPGRQQAPRSVAVYGCKVPQNQLCQPSAQRCSLRERLSIFPLQYRHQQLPRCHVRVQARRQHIRGAATARRQPAAPGLRQRALHRRCLPSGAFADVIALLVA